MNQALVSAAGLGQPFYLSQGLPAPILCWWHAPSEASRAAPLLMCPTWGDEELATYQGWRALALSMAQAGVPVLRLDLPGEGDSADAPAGQDRWPLWLAALERAAQWLADQTGQTQIQLLGLRLGALLAAQLAQRLHAHSDIRVCRMAWLAPVASGRQFLREARMLTGQADEALQPGEVQAGGFVLEPSTAASLQQAQWPAMSDLPDCPLWVGLRSDRPLPETLRQKIQAYFSDSTWRDCELTAWFGVAHSTELAPEVIAQLRAWCSGGATQNLVAVADLGPGCQMVVDGVRESLQALGAGAWAQVCEPDTQPVRQGLVLLSSGAERRIGPHRLWVPLSRRLARQGWRVMRLDLPGVGDSPAWPHAQNWSRADQIYDAQHQTAVQMAVDALRADPQIDRVAIVGICSGAYHAWRQAVLGRGVDVVVPVNPLVFHWRQGMSLDPTHHAFGQIDIAQGALRSLTKADRWLKLLRGQVKWQLILRALAGRWAGLLRSAGRSMGRQLGWSLREDVVSDMRQSLRQQTHLHFLFAQSDPGQTLLRQQAGGRLERWLADGSVQLNTLAGADHTFSTRSQRLRLYNCVSVALGVGEDSHLACSNPLASKAPSQS